MRGKRTIPGVTAVAASLAMLAAACGGAGADSGLRGSVVVSGSSTVEPISVLNAEKFIWENAGVEISVDGPGTGDGFELFCNGETDISDASRTIKEEEIVACEENGVGYIELEVAIDGLAVLTSTENEQVGCLSFGDLYALLGPESEGFRSWSEANALAVEVGGSGNFPDAPLEVTAPGEESGTYDTFVELGLGGIAEERGQEEVSRPDYQASANDNVIIEGISGSATSLGWVGYAFYAHNRDVVRALEVDGGDGCVAPTEETISSGEYQLARSLYIYVNEERAVESEALRAYVDFYLSDEGFASVEEVGYVRLPSERIEASRSTWASVGM